ncbi:hypothetical protein GQX73_g6007 [Xylaria multiplex]|uniref:MYND-type domain-containing protein n=1 Tax=Xylaria multiplex TaxID=323545 RepID=A0A7C8IMN7_9PEZI|nr:hypothetical protein GQX73_g6007 [Xylaria multiplex]
MIYCANCWKALSDETHMRKCCDGIYYCNRECKRQDFKHHKTSCPNLIPKGTPQLPDAALSKKVASPFYRLQRGDYLQGLPATDIYKLLIDAYRLRVEDNKAYAGTRGEDSIYGNAHDGLEGFRNFINRAKEIPRMLPPWWSDKKQAECEGLGRLKGWSSLSCKIDGADVRSHYNDRFMDIQLRFLAEDIYGTGIGDRQKRFLRPEVEKLTDSANFRTGVLLRRALSYHLLKLSTETGGDIWLDPRLMRLMKDDITDNSSTDLAGQVLMLRILELVE